MKLSFSLIVLAVLGLLMSNYFHVNHYHGLFNWAIGGTILSIIGAMVTADHRTPMLHE